MIPLLVSCITPAPEGPRREGNAAPSTALPPHRVYVPELVTDALKEPAWEALLGEARPDHVIVYERGPQSFVLLLESTPSPR